MKVMKLWWGKWFLPESYPCQEIMEQTWPMLPLVNMITKWVKSLIGGAGNRYYYAQKHSIYVTRDDRAVIRGRVPYKRRNNGSSV